MDLKLRFYTSFGESEEAGKLWEQILVNIPTESSALTTMLQRIDKEEFGELDLAALKKSIWRLYCPEDFKSTTLFPAVTEQIVSGNQKPEAEILIDLQKAHFLESFKDCWQEVQEREKAAFSKNKNYPIYESLRKELQEVLNGTSFFSSSYFQRKYGESVLENIKQVLDFINKILKYTPRPYDTSRISLPGELSVLLEDMAENIHENWSALRLEQGWKYGITRNGDLHAHPCLVPYDLLPELEKDYDRQTSLETLKFILAKEYKILPPQAEVSFDSLSASELKSLNVRELLKIQQRLKNDQNCEVKDFLVLGQAFQQLAEKVLSYETFQIGIQRLGGDRKSQLYRDMTFNAARSLADCYAYKEAEKLLRSLYDKGFTDGYITGQLAKIRKTLALKQNDQEYLGEALEFYKQGYESALNLMKLHEHLSDTWYSALDQAIYNGINTATMYMLSHEKALCVETAENVLQLCLSKEETRVSYWDKASMGEACLLEAEIEKAAEYYKEAAAEAPPGDVESMITQIRAICKYLELNTDWISKVFVVPAALIFSGHSIDREGEYRFPNDDEVRVRDEIKAFLDKEKPGFGYCSANPGSELIFIEQMLARDAEVHIYIPYEIENFRRLFEGLQSSWLSRFDKAVEKVTSITVTGTYDEGLNDANRQFNNKYMVGLARLKAESSNCELKALTLWDGEKESNSDSVPGAVSIWNDIGLDYKQIKTAGSKSLQKNKSLRFSDTKVEESLCMLFADVKGYSKLAGEQLILFTKQFMGKSDKIISEYDDQVVIRRSQGDGLFIVFKSIEAAIAVSVGLKEMVLETDWESLGLPGDLTARFALDSGPCYSFTDPIARQFDLSGAHVIRAARLEPVTPPGHIFASEGFAAICALNNLQDHFELAGQVKLPKSYGEMRVYYLDRR